MNTYLFIAEVDNRISEIEKEIERWVPFTDDGGPNTASTVDQAQSKVDALENEKEELENFSTEITRCGVDEDAVDAALDYTGGDLDRTAELVRYGVADYASAREYGEQLIDSLYMRKEIEALAAYIDYESFGSDALMDLEYHEHNGRIYVFQN